MATLVVSVTQNFSADSLLDIDRIEFTNTAAATATFASLQFDDAAILDDVTLAGSLLAASHLAVSGGSLIASRWQFSGWDELTDTISLTGSGGADVITGSAMADRIKGGSGADRLDGGSGDDTINGGRHSDIITGGAGTDLMKGGDGNDRFKFSNSLHLQLGEVIDGGTGAGDRIVLAGNGSVMPFIGRAMTGIEILELRGSGNAAALDGAQIGLPGGISRVIGSDGWDSISVAGALIDLSGITFTNWNVQVSILEPNPDNILLNGTAGADTIIAPDHVSELTGGDGADTLRGGSSDDVFQPGNGLDSSYGGGGDDTFLFFLNEELESLEVIDGGDGIDTIKVFETDADVTYDLRTALPTGLEKLEVVGTPLSNTTTTITFTALYLGADGITEVTARADTVVDVEGPGIDVSAITFTVFGADTELSVVLRGDDTANIIIGSSRADQISGREGDDVLDGGGGDDVITGGFGRDALTGGAGNDVFVYLSPDETPTGPARDRIDDFTQGEDVIAFAEGGGYVFLGLAAFSASGAPEINYVQSGTNTIVQIDGDGDGSAEAKIAISVLVDLNAGDFLL